MPQELDALAQDRGAANAAGSLQLARAWMRLLARAWVWLGMRLRPGRLSRVVAGEPEVADAPAAVDEPAAVAGSRSRRLYAWRWRSQREPGERGQRATPSWCRSGSSALWSR
uniref:Uncharacterized protein n=1 Tax=Zea mays TaxID=4577 RepID=A0A804QAS3_MAIZE